MDGGARNVKVCVDLYARDFLVAKYTLCDIEHDLITCEIKALVCQSDFKLLHLFCFLYPYSAKYGADYIVVFLVGLILCVLDGRVTFIYRRTSLVIMFALCTLFIEHYHAVVDFVV